MASIMNTANTQHSVALSSNTLFSICVPCRCGGYHEDQHLEQKFSPVALAPCPNAQ
ncbi:hypothetical protein BGW80DRAFT_1301579 [Lactifluus volemus]|nr:hypothetical protein BGW80DRAFT_1301579 [Lactifluus volemus]